MTLDGVSLPRGLMWSNEFEWQPVAQATARRINGGLLVEESSRSGGRPIRLEGDRNHGWARRDLVSQLSVMAAETGADRQLVTDDGRTFSVRFDNTQQAVIAAPLQRNPRPTADSLYSLTINLIEV